MNFTSYLEALATEHRLIRHSQEECHFSNLAEDQAIKSVRILNYPCVSVENNDFAMTGMPGNTQVADIYHICFLSHVKDTGDLAEVNGVFNLTREIMFDFIKRMQRDKRKGIEAVCRFDLSETEGSRIYFRDMALYGWVISVIVPSFFSDHLCNNAFID